MERRGVERGGGGSGTGRARCGVSRATLRPKAYVYGPKNGL
jgi:hypothetical protein